MKSKTDTGKSTILDYTGVLCRGMHSYGRKDLRSVEFTELVSLAISPLFSVRWTVLEFY